jgi:hypothetical protein
MLIPGEFGFADDLHAGDNVLSLANLPYASGIQKKPLVNLLCAPGIKVIPGELESGSPGLKIQKIQKKIQKVQKKVKRKSKNRINIENYKYTIF